MHNKMKLAKSEEDVKAILIESLKLINYNLGEVDLKTDKIWFETKFDSLAMKHIANTFCQLFNYVQKAKNEGKALPSHLAIADDVGLALLEYNDIAYLFDNYDFTSYIASNPSKAIVSSIDDEIKHLVRSYKYSDGIGLLVTHINEIQRSGLITKISIMPRNLPHTYDKWHEAIGSRLIYEDSKAKVEDNDIIIAVFYSDIFYDKQSEETLENHYNLFFKKGRPYFISNKGNLILDSNESYHRFWKTYERPPKREYKNRILERRDLLIAVEKRKFTGAFYTPLDGVAMAYNYLAKELGDNWQDEYYLWDMAGGSGNLCVNHTNKRNCFISTLDDSDINIMKTTKEVVGATVFQYDYLNDDVSEMGLDYNITNKLPDELRRIIKEESHKLVVLINPPYGEATAGINTDAENAKPNISNTNVKSYLGHSNELYIQFIIRMQNEIPKAKLAMFSTLKYINAPQSESFRASFTGQFINGFILHSKLFESKGNFPIGFLLWQLGAKEKFGQVELDVYNDDYEIIGTKTFISHTSNQMLNKWFERPRSNEIKVMPLKNAIAPYTGQLRLDRWSDGAIGYICSSGNDIQHTIQNTFIVSGVYGNGNGFHITHHNLAQTCVLFSVRRLVSPTWLNNRDQFLIPHTNPPEEFYNDCLIYTLFNASNLSASADGLEYNGQKWSIVNHFIPFSEEQLNSPSRFESDFMVKYLKNLTLSSEATAVMAEGLVIWQEYYQTDFEPSIAIELKLNRCDVGWYQVRNALKKHKGSDICMKNFNIAYTKLATKLEPQVYKYGFLVE